MNPSSKLVIEPKGIFTLLEDKVGFTKTHWIHDLPLKDGYTLTVKNARRLLKNLNVLSGLEAQVFLFCEYKNMGEGMASFVDDLNKKEALHTFNANHWGWIKKAMYSYDTTRDNVQGLKVINGMVYVTNGHILMSMVTGCMNMELQGLNSPLIKKLSPKSIEVIETTNGHKALFLDREWLFVSKDEAFADVMAVSKELPSINYLNLDLDVKAMVKSLKMIKKVWAKEDYADDSDQTQKVTFTDDGQTLSLNDFNLTLKIPFESHDMHPNNLGSDFKVSFNIDYLLDILRTNEKVKISLNDSNEFSPMFVELDNERKAVIMPLTNKVFL